MFSQNKSKNQSGLTPLDAYEQAIKLAESIANEQNQVDHQLKTLHSQAEATGNQLKELTTQVTSGEQTAQAFQAKLLQHQTSNDDRLSTLETATHEIQATLDIQTKTMSQLRSQITHSETTDNLLMKDEIVKKLDYLSGQIQELQQWILLTSPVTGYNYQLIQQYLEAQNFHAADLETQKYLYKLGKEESKGWLDDWEIDRLVWIDVRLIDRLWLKYSDGRFGFSQQAKIYHSFKIENPKHFARERKLCKACGWKIDDDWTEYERYTFDLTAPHGHLPALPKILNFCRGQVEARILKFLRQSCF